MECASTLSEYASDQWHIVPVSDASKMISIVEETNQKAQTRISTFFIDTRVNG